MTNYRKVKTQRKFDKRDWGHVTVPSLILKGKWLEDAGFDSGMQCSVKVEKGRLTILAI